MTKTVGIDLVLSAHWRADDGKKSPHLPEGFPEIGWLGHLVTALETCPGHRARLLEEGELAGGAADVDVLLLPVPHGVADRALSPSEEAGLRAFVESGGGLLLFGDSATPDPEAAGAALPLLTGVSLTESLVSTARPAPDSHLLAYGLDATPVPGHAATTGVHALHVHRARALEGAQRLHPLAVGAGGVLAAAGQLGAGRIAVVGNGAMFTLPFLGCADNARFLVNLVQWLSGGEPEAGAAGEATRLITEGHRFSARLFSPSPIWSVCPAPTRRTREPTGGSSRRSAAARCPIRMTTRMPSWRRRSCGSTSCRARCASRWCSSHSIPMITAHCW